MKISEDTIRQLLDSLYDRILNESVFDLAQDYMNKHGDPEAASKALIKHQAAKCAASGFITGLGGALVLPVTVPADLAATYYVQLRMAAAIAHIYGHNIHEEQVKNFIYLSLAGDGIKDVVKGLVTKQAFKAMKIGRLIPLAGGFLGAGFNSYYCLKVGEAAIGFFSNDLDQAA